MSPITKSASTSDEFAISLGIEEELFLIDPSSRDLLTHPSPEIIEECKRKSGKHKVVPEFLCSQIEINTKVCGSIADVREALKETRRLIVNAAEHQGAAAIAASTHPFAAWDVQTPTPGERYHRLAVTWQESIRRFLAGGMHIHVGFGDPNSRLRVMTACRRYLPLLHALSTSSPFSVGRETGYKSHRLNLYSVLHRTGVPQPLRSRAQYDDLIANYQQLEFIEDARELWWDIRLAFAYPTIELRICDICPRIDDTRQHRSPLCLLDQVSPSKGRKLQVASGTPN